MTATDGCVGLPPTVGPRPQPDGDSEAYWQRLHAGDLTVQRCRECGAAQHYHRAICTTCWSDQLDLEVVSGRGVVYSHTTIHQTGDPGLKGELPLHVALIELAEGPRMMTRIVGEVAPTVGATVRLALHRMDDEIVLPLFEVENA